MICPKCSSENVQVHYETEKKGFSGGQGCCGWLIFGPIGLLCGLCGKDKVTSEEKYWVCNNCGAKFTDAEAATEEKRRKRDAVLMNAENNFLENPSAEILNKKNQAIDFLKKNLTIEDLSRFIFDYRNADEKTVKAILWTYIKPDFDIDLSSDCIYFMYNESTIGDGLGTIFTNNGIYCHGAFAKPIFLRKEDITYIGISGRDIKINDKIFLDFAKIKTPEAFSTICDTLNTLYGN